ncbi:hypothetical protein JRQ81_003129 [Phrynocephalus forsythii]|uniref:Uncharacterized protein n=1 Tax=Phrynocephalus forsythii TaxID=171643 RepID=A0A9Q1AWM0_9SAUR|nr:hypothetical protein JRQ81_003129 [Phrynocephalus forsythii]
MSNSSLPKKCYIEQLQHPLRESWVKLVRPILHLYGINTESMPSFVSPSIKKLVKDKIYLCSKWKELAVVSLSPFSLYYPLFKTSFRLESYFHNLTSAPLRTAFTALRFQTMPSAFLEGRHDNIPVSDRLCPCGSGEVNDVPHYLLRCPLHEQPRGKFLGGIISLLADKSPGAQLSMLLVGTDRFVTQQVAKFALAAMKIRVNL